MSYDSDVVAATSGRGGEADWDKIIKLCDRIRESYGPTAMGAALGAVMRRAKHNDPLIQLQALTLLEACVSNCGRDFQVELTKTSFHSQVKDILNTRTSDARTIQRLKTLLVTWAVEYRTTGYMGGLVQYVEQLAREGVVVMPQTSAPGYSGTSTLPAATQQGDDDLERAIRLSLQEAQNNPSSSGNTMYPSFSPKESKATSGKKVRALYDFEAVEDNELTFKAGEIITILDDSDENWWKGQTQLGTGLFPANFVSTDLKASPEPVRGEQKKATTTTTTTTGGNTKKVVEVNESQVDLLLDMLKTADITSTNEEENKTLIGLEEECKVMKTMVEKNITNYQSDIDEMNDVSKQLQDVFALYRKLLQEGPRISEKAQMAQTLPTVAPPTYQSTDSSYYMPPPPDSMYNVPPSYGQQPYAATTSYGASYTTNVPPTNYGAPPINQGGPTSFGAPPINQGGLTSLGALPNQGGPTSLGAPPIDPLATPSLYSQPQSYGTYSSGPPPSMSHSPTMGRSIPMQVPPTGHTQYPQSNGTQFSKTPPTGTMWDHTNNVPPPQTMTYQPLM